GSLLSERQDGAASWRASHLRPARYRKGCANGCAVGASPAHARRGARLRLGKGAALGVTLADVEKWLTSKEAEHLEFKEAKTGFGSDELRRYVIAIGNEGGGHLVLGVTNKLPRKVVGTNAFLNGQKTEMSLYDKFRRVVRCTELQHPDGRVVVFEIP